MSETRLRDRVREVLHDVDERGGSLVTGDGDAESDLLETAREAADILESADPDDLLSAVGLDTLEDGSEPDSIPEAIARGERERVADLQRLLRLSRLADRADDGGLGDAVGDLQEAIGDRGESAADTAESAVDADGSEGTADAETTAGSDAAESTESESGAESSTDDLGDGLRSAMRDSFADFGDEVSQLKARLEERRAGAADSDADDTTAGDEAAAAEAEAADEDEGLLGPGLGGDRERGTASGGPSRHSTMAPPPSQRADMRGTARHSTMPDKRG
ncbi:hypothetical protein NP511_04140 [Natrinema thermotolerans]|uniref:Uncharacterized protein n=1 Tax=Natrinema thermotolerans TaxID=121872 RepID=A0AAF0PGI8_9EURY|nr:hypothetical protein [Natrinema thermotolerans]QCC57741.1 hypothetical protein DVR14_03420 [Natrinema thermotolerans]WMT08825.1 hypothetical protein NP511_04140 [Natrinema thermotolerans]